MDLKKKITLLLTVSLLLVMIAIAVDSTFLLKFYVFHPPLNMAWGVEIVAVAIVGYLVFLVFSKLLKFNPVLVTVSIVLLVSGMAFLEWLLFHRTMIEITRIYLLLIGAFPLSTTIGCLLASRQKIEERK